MGRVGCLVPIHFFEPTRAVPLSALFSFYSLVHFSFSFSLFILLFLFSLFLRKKVSFLLY